MSKKTNDKEGVCSCICSVIHDNRGDDSNVDTTGSNGNGFIIVYYDEWKNRGCKRQWRKQRDYDLRAYTELASGYG